MEFPGLKIREVGHVVRPTEIFGLEFTPKSPFSLLNMLSGTGMC